MSKPRLPKQFEPKVKPFDHQLKAISYLLLNEQAGLLLDLGLGKTYCAITAFDYWIKIGRVDKVLCVVPAGLMYNWKRECEKFSHYKALVILSSIREERKYLINKFYTEDQWKFGIINYEALSPYIEYLRPTDGIVADETARYARNHAAKRTRALIQLGDAAEYKALLTGRLIAAKPMGLWSQFRFLTGGETFGVNFWKWRNYFFNKKIYRGFPKWELNQNRKQLLMKRIYSCCIAMDKRKVFPDIPPVRYQPIHIKLDAAAKSDYNKLQNKVIAEIEAEVGSTTVTAAHIFTKLIRLQQYTSGFIKDDTGRIQVLKFRPKFDALMEKTEEILFNGESVIIWCRFRPAISMISDELRKKHIKHTVMTGDDSQQEKYKKWKGFQKSKTINVFVGQITSGGIGIELFKTDTDKEYQHMIFYENTFVLDDRDQAIGRADARLGQQTKLNVVDLIVENTIDEKIMKSIMGDKKIADEIMNFGVRKYLGGN